jgi:hypothetical protein
MNNFEKKELGKKIIDLITRKKSVTTQDILDRFPEPIKDVKETLIYLQKLKKIYAIDKPVKSPNKIKWGLK